MRKLQDTGAAFFVALTLTAVASTSASAAQWLIGGNPITTAQSAVTEAKWLWLGLTFFGLEKVHVVCNGELIGTVGPNGEDEVTSVTDLSGKATLHCELLLPEGGCLSDLVFVTDKNLPWKTELLEPKTNEFVDHFKANGKGNPAFLFECELKTGSFTAETCEATSFSTNPLKNASGGGVEGTLTNQELTKCDSAGPILHIYSEGTTRTLSGTLTVSE